MRLKKIITGFFLFIFFCDAGAQGNECEQTLSHATEEFNSGHFYIIPSLIKHCLDRNDFTNEQRVRAYLLLAQAYLIVDDPIAAEDSYLKLLKANPEFIATKEKDPIDVVYLSSKFTATPIFTPHLRIGANASFVRTIYNISTSPYPEKIKHILKPGFQVGGGMDWNINDNFSLCVDAILSYKVFKTVDKLSSASTTTVTEKQYWIDVPVYLKYTFNKGQIRPFGYAGYAANVLMGSRGTLELDTQTGLSAVQSTGKDERFTYRQVTFNRSLVFGGGVRYKIGRDYLFADVRYMAGLSNLTAKNIYAQDPKSPSSPPQLVTGNELSYYQHVDRYYRLDNLSISFGYVRPLYNPRRLKRSKAKSILRKIKKEENGGN